MEAVSMAPASGEAAFAGTQAQDEMVEQMNADIIVLPAIGVKEQYHYQHKPVYEVLRRVCDIAFSIIGIVLASPIMLATAIAIKLEDGGPVVFRQPRIGKGRKTFHMYKFRSMCKNAEEKLDALDKEQKREFSESFKLEHDPRITKVGRFIRKTSIDELLQFVNILKGEMSLVGPRPPLLAEEEAYGINLERVMSIRPGLTGYWQVHGRNNTSFSERIDMNLYYIRNASWLLDIEIIFQTIAAVFSRKGAV